MSALELFSDLPVTLPPRRVEVPEQETDNWFTKLPLWRKLDAQYHYDADAFGHNDAPVTRLICERGGVAIIPPTGDAFEQSLVGRRVWANPPYSQPTMGQAIEWAWNLFANQQHGPELITMLLHGGKCEQPSWHKCVEPFRDAGPFQPGAWQWTCSTRFVEGRESFGFPGDPEGLTGGNGRFSSVLVHFQRWEPCRWSGGDRLRRLDLSRP